MLTDIFLEFKSWWLGKSVSSDKMDEFERIESKHTRVHYDEDIYEIIRVH
jgi:hypothetical protein